MDKRSEHNNISLQLLTHQVKLGHTPESYSGKKPDFSHLQIFGCTYSFVHIVEEDKNKLEPKSCEGVLVGYDEVTKGYRCLIP